MEIHNMNSTDTPPYPVHKYPNGDGVDAEKLRESADENSRNKRTQAPEGVGDACPVCNEPYDIGASGPVWPGLWNSIDTVSWARVCSGAAPNAFVDIIDNLHEYPAESVPFSYVHKDEHITND